MVKPQTLIAECLATALATSILTFQLLIPPVMGLADNGDYYRVSGRVGLDHANEAHDKKYFKYLQLKYKHIEPGAYPPGFITSEVLFAKAALFISDNVTSSNLFDLRTLGAVHEVAFIFAFWLLMFSLRPLGLRWQIVVAAVMTLFLTDARYICYFNSFFSESATTIFFMSTAALCLLITHKRLTSPVGWLLFLLVSILLITSKPQYAPVGVLLALWSMWEARPRFRGLVIALPLVLFSLWYYARTPEVAHRVVSYTMLFGEILANSPKPEDDLIFLKLDPDLVKYINTSAFSPDAPINDPDFQRRLFARFKLTDVIGFYMVHPQRLWELLKRCTPLAVEFHPFVGAYTPDSGKPAHTEPLGLWSSLRRALPKSPWFSFLMLAMLTAIALTRRESFMILLVSISVVCFLTACLAQGTWDLSKHLHLSNLSFDMCLALAIPSIFQSRASAMRGVAA